MRYGAILADPPWAYHAWSGNTNAERGWGTAASHYRTMSPDDIARIPVSDMAAKDAHLFLWTTGPVLRQAFDVIEAWGFRYSAIAFTWVKLKRSFDARQLRAVPLAEADLHVGLGLTTRKNAEFCLLGRRGSCQRKSRSVREIILAPVREHSRKPDDVYSRIEAYCDGPYLELFARQRWPGWDAWGEETDKFEPVA